MLEARDLTIRFGRDFTAVDRVTFVLRPGELVVLCGPNGAGKSTLLAALAGDLPPSEGTVWLEDAPVAGMSPRHLALRRAVLEQSPTLSAPFSIAELVGLSIGRDVTEERARRIIDEALALTGLTDRRDSQADRLSGGQRHRAHLARVLAQLAAGNSALGSYLLLDEPTASLDVKHQISIMQLARRMAREGTGVLVVLHDLNLAAAFADRIGLMHHGRMVATGTPQDVLTPESLSGIYDTPITVTPRNPGAGIRIEPAYG
jgi:iron complex transport system ATP-binding protein